jgi:hypothetical protein
MLRICHVFHTADASIFGMLYTMHYSIIIKEKQRNAQTVYILVQHLAPMCFGNVFNLC